MDKKIAIHSSLFRYRPMKAFLCWILTIMAGLALGQNTGYAVIEGMVYVNNRAVPNVDIKVYLKNQEIKHVRSIHNGSFQVNLAFNQKYNIEISKFGLVTKRFIFNSEIPDGQREDQIYPFPLQLDLFPPFEEIDISLLDEPMANIEFDKVIGTYSFDIGEATEKVKKVRALQEEIAKILEVKAKLFKLEFDNAEMAYKQRNYVLAKSDYLKSLNVYPVNSARLYIDVDYINNRISSIDKLLSEKETKEKAKAIKKAFDDAVAMADNSFERKQYDEAADQYNKALEIKPSDNYPRKKLDKINDIVSKNIVINLVSSSTVFKNGVESKLKFAPIKSYLKKGNYLLLKIRNNGTENLKVYVKFGKNTESAGGFVLKDLPVDQFKDCYIKISSNDQWFRMDANWISIYPEGGDIEITEIKLTRTD